MHSASRIDDPVEDRVEFSKKQRETLELLKGGVVHKAIADALEISVRTVQDRIAKSCAIAGVVDQTELRLFLYQNPGILMKGARCAPGLHIPIMRGASDKAVENKICGCGDPDCVGWISMMLRRA